MLLDAGTGAGGATVGIMNAPVANIVALKEVPNPHDGEVRQVLEKIIGSNPKVVFYVFNTIATEGIPADDGTSGRWNLLGEDNSDYTRIISTVYIPASTILDLDSLPTGVTKTKPTDPLDTIALDASIEQTYLLNRQEVGLTVISPTQFTLDKSLHLGSYLELQTREQGI